MYATKGDVDMKLKAVDGGQVIISWHLIHSEINKNRTLIIGLEQRIRDGKVDSVTLSDKDCYIRQRRNNKRPNFLFGIYSCHGCDTLVDLIEQVEDYESVCVKTYQVNENTGERITTGLVHWSESHNELTFHNKNKVKRFGWTGEELKKQK